MQHEGRVGQTFSLDLVLDTDLTEASRSDKLADTVGYDQVVEIATKALGARRYRLGGGAGGAGGAPQGLGAPAAIGWSRPRPARSPPPSSSASHELHGSGSRSTSPTRRSRRPLPMSGSPSCALVSVSDVGTGACRPRIAILG